MHPTLLQRMEVGSLDVACEEMQKHDVPSGSSRDWIAEMQSAPVWMAENPPTRRNPCYYSSPPAGKVTIMQGLAEYSWKANQTRSEQSVPTYEPGWTSKKLRKEENKRHNIDKQRAKQI